MSGSDSAPPARGLRACAAWLLPAGLWAIAPPAAAHAPTGSAGTPAIGWSIEPWVIASLLLSAIGYGLGLMRLWRHAGRGRGVSRWAASAFGAGWLALVAALMSPLDQLGTRLFSAHMVQHELLMAVAAPLMIVGRPVAVWAWALAPAWRRRIGRWFHRAAWRRPWLQLTSPLTAWLVHAAAIWGWHAPALFDAALADDGVHTLQHFCFLFSALLFWWSALGQTSRQGRGAAMLYLFTTMMHSAALGALLTLASFPWYPAYAGSTAAFGLDPLEDQQLGGLVMWVPAGIAYFATGLALAAQWLHGPRPAERSPAA